MEVYVNLTARLNCFNGNHTQFYVNLKYHILIYLERSKYHTHEQCIMTNVTRGISPSDLVDVGRQERGAMRWVGSPA